LEAGITYTYTLSVVTRLALGTLGAWITYLHTVRCYKIGPRNIGSRDHLPTQCPLLQDWPSEHWEQGSPTYTLSVVTRLALGTLEAWITYLHTVRCYKIGPRNIGSRDHLPTHCPLLQDWPSEHWEQGSPTYTLSVVTRLALGTPGAGITYLNTVRCYKIGPRNTGSRDHLPTHCPFLHDWPSEHLEQRSPTYTLSVVTRLALGTLGAGITGNTDTRLDLAVPAGGGNHETST